FEADTPDATRMQVVNDPLPLPSARNSQLDLIVQRTLLKALAKDPENRWESGEAFIGALAESAQLTLQPFAPRTHSLALMGEPTGAEVTVDGQLRGTLPCLLDGLPA